MLRGQMHIISSVLPLVITLIVAFAFVIPVTMTIINGVANQTISSCSGMRTLDNPDSRINDLAGVLSSGERASLASFISDTYSKKCIDVGVIITNDTHGIDLFSYTTAAFDSAGLGGKNDSGLLMAISVKDKQYFIETGYGLEQCMPDGKVGTAARARMFYPVLDDYAGRTGGGGQGGTMKASGYGTAIVETLRTLTDGCTGNSADQTPASSMAQAMQMALSFFPIIVVAIIITMTMTIMAPSRY
jgi:uncharacterized membrane protein YgcG